MDLTSPNRANAPVAIVTGAASGIGRAIALRLAALGYRLVLWDLDHEGLRHVQASLLPSESIEHELVVADTSDADMWAGFASTLQHDGASVALLVQAAGVLVAGRLADCKPVDVERLVSVNLTGVVLGAQAMAPLLAASQTAGGDVPLPRGMLNIASIFATVAPPGFAAYNAAKAGVIALTETLSGEWAPVGLTATAVLPGVTPTGLFTHAAYADDRFREMVRRHVGASELTADAVADAALVAYRRRKLVVPIGRRATRYYWLKRWLPKLVLRRVAEQANRELEK
ncbi:SDR family NAD(P)-dependent oxidoreductase [Botrimarina mediterranea]|uniref:Oxidoreductase SadH n=1 Tax=Botrimarina mediterranea TaxID=2528022 RepID=A0A518KBM0_9BACT|nr:SDR family oxidoreductase [Botrimarina mediterranea]QDV75191.1 Putative oxidoreductase SadH [Botrimarina mediterranea]QDV79837.1 Putative oxidoreductase SadH [Planctomycetes bacterium K2D]